jgi:hypothetical protein
MPGSLHAIAAWDSGETVSVIMEGQWEKRQRPILECVWKMSAKYGIFMGKPDRLKMLERAAV